MILFQAPQFLTTCVNKRLGIKRQKYHTKFRLLTSSSTMFRDPRKRGKDKIQSYIAKKGVRSLLLVPVIQFVVIRNVFTCLPFSALNICGIAKISNKHNEQSTVSSLPSILTDVSLRH